MFTENPYLDLEFETEIGLEKTLIELQQNTIKACKKRLTRPLTPEQEQRIYDKLYDEVVDILDKIIFENEPKMCQTPRGLTPVERAFHRRNQI